LLPGPELPARTPAGQLELTKCVALNDSPFSLSNSIRIAFVRALRID
jgi:hypothetical protein